MVAPVHVASKYYIRPDEQCSHWVGVYRFAIIRCTVPPTVSLAWSHICKGILEIPQLQCTPLVLISWIGMGYPCLRSTTGYYLLVHPLSNYVRPPIQLQHTDGHTDSSRHCPLSKSQHTPLLRSPALELTLNGIHNNFPQSYPTSSSPLIYAIQIQNKVLGTRSDWFSRVFFIITNTMWLDRDLLHLSVLTMAMPTGKYSSQLEIIEYLSR